MDEKKIFAGLTVVIGLMLVGAVVTSMVSRDDVREMVDDGLKPVTESLAALDTRLAGVETDLGGLADQVSQGVSQESLTALQDRLEAMASSAAPAADLETIRAQLADVAGRAEALADRAISSDDLAALQARIDDIAGVSGSLGDEIAALRDRVAEAGGAGGLVAAAAAAVAPKPEASAAETAAAPEPEEEEVAGEPGFMPGQTALFGDGALRVFVSKLDPAADAVRVSIGGQMQTLTVGQSRMMAAGDGYCELGLDGVSRNGALLTGVCGDALAAPEGIRVGETAVLGDGAVRVFASKIDTESARLSVNGDLVTLAVGRSAPVMAGEARCRVRLGGIDRRHAAVDLLCGDAVAVSDPVSPGAATVLGDGAARVFLASVRDGEARFAVNGVSLVGGGPGTAVELDGGCHVAVEDILERGATFSYVCAD